ncbi:MAG: dTDP-4-dehydrorhamnose 3,5-epimerase [Gemmataceae bacterium]|nr:dTDP-4-dehydrorhamnose 3,5-epimerase [Gemmataceae bacterium]
MKNQVAVAIRSREKKPESLCESVLFTAEQCLDLLPFRPGTVADVSWKPLHPNHDERGWLCELFRHDEMPGDVQPAMGYLSETLPGATRGPHEHLQQTDNFCFFGPTTFKLYLWDNRSESPTYLCHEIAVIGGARPMSVTIPPGVVHAYRNVGAVVGLIVNCPNRLYRGDGRGDPVDEVRHEDDPRSAFRVYV